MAPSNRTATQQLPSRPPRLQAAEGSRIALSKGFPRALGRGMLAHGRPSRPGAVNHLLSKHGDAYDAWYPPHEFVDHARMAVLALCGLGASLQRIETFHASYVRRLRPLSNPSVALDDATLRTAYGDPKAYSALRTYFAGELHRRGISAALHRYLPELISGWVKDAYHPLIRLGCLGRADGSSRNQWLLRVHLVT